MAAPDERFPNALLIDRGARFIAVQSGGWLQMRGNGLFVLTKDEIFFERWVPRREYRVPVASITGIETVHRFHGKATGARMLKVSFTNAEGKPDAIAWNMGQIDAVIEQLNRLIKPT